MKKIPFKQILLFGGLLLSTIGALIVVFLFLDSVFGIDNTGDVINRISQEEEEVDNTPLEVSIDEEQREILEGFLTVLVEANKEIEVRENNRMNMVFVKEENGTYYYVLEITTIPVGDSVLTININDKVGNTETFKVPVERKPGFSFQGQDYIPAFPDSTYIVDGDDLLSFLNKQRRLLVTYAPDDLVNLRENYINLFLNDESFELREEAASQLDQMLNVMRNEIDKNVVVASAYRSYETQAQLYSSYVSQYGQEETDTFSARPGYSEHQLGTVVDFVNEESGFSFDESFGNTQAGIWLRDNSYKYGFIMTYPEGSEELTGYAYEPWQFRYIGVENALELEESGMLWVEWAEEL